MICTPHGSKLVPDCFDWWTSGLRQEFLHPSDDPKLAWLHTELKGISATFSSAGLDDDVTGLEDHDSVGTTTAYDVDQEASIRFPDDGY